MEAAEEAALEVLALRNAAENMAVTYPCITL